MFFNFGRDLCLFGGVRLVLGRSNMRKNDAFDKYAALSHELETRLISFTHSAWVIVRAKRHSR